MIRYLNLVLIGQLFIKLWSNPRIPTSKCGPFPLIILNSIFNMIFEGSFLNVAGEIVSVAICFGSGPKIS